ncbi:hypothetical protein SDC9_205125 [bioreactor metagenome]|uniref:Uncharacterized protein n=1 Tax=bioreactor metagenome TaxID=1076179 RepID=A0A645J1G9_9ZZZZ
MIQYFKILRRVRAGKPLPLQQIDIGDDGRQRRFQIVGHIGDQVGLQSLVFQFILDRDVGRFRDFIDPPRQLIQLAAAGHVYFIGEVSAFYFLDALLDILVFLYPPGSENNDQKSRDGGQDHSCREDTDRQRHQNDLFHNASAEIKGLHTIPEG